MTEDTATKDRTIRLKPHRIIYAVRTRMGEKRFFNFDKGFVFEEERFKTHDRANDFFEKKIGKTQFTQDDDESHWIYIQLMKITCNDVFSIKEEEINSWHNAQWYNSQIGYQ